MYSKYPIYKLIRGIKHLNRSINEKNIKLEAKQILSASERLAALKERQRESILIG